MTASPFTAVWDDEIHPVQPESKTTEPEAKLEPPQRVADGYYWLSYDSPSRFPGLPVEVRGPYCYMPGSTTPYNVNIIMDEIGGVFLPIAGECHQ